jgi:translocation and assembly module TamA
MHWLGKPIGLLCLVVSVVGGAPAFAADGAAPAGQGAAGETTPDGGGLPYEPVITGVEDADLNDLLKSASQLFSLIDRQPATIASLERRAQGDLGRLGEALRSEGYYDASLSYRLERNAQPIPVRLEVATGPRYTLGGYTIVYEKSPPPEAAAQPSLADIGIKLGMPARAPDVRTAERKAVAVLQERGYPFAKSAELKATVDHDKHEMTVRLAIDAGPRATLGALHISGLKSVEEDYIRRISDWREGAVFDQRKLDGVRAALNGTGLFSSAKITKATQLDDDGRLPVTAEVVESPHRSIGAGLRYSTDVGVGADVFWEHRNILQRNETLGFSVTAAQIEQVGRVNFRKPAFLRLDQALLANAEVSNRNTDAFDQQNVAGTVSLERPLFEKWKGTAGVTASYDFLKDSDGEQEVQLFGLPVTASRTATDNPLNPTRGSLLDLAATPSMGASNEPLQFLRMSAGGSAYHAVDKEARYILAGRMKLGSIIGESSATLPADKRFYAGGGGSVRGYEFQKVGPLDANRDPLGGRSLVELSGELRIRVTEKIGLVPFIDGGAVSGEPYPNFQDGMQWAGGLGLRYFTGFGPLRLDVATPINPRKDDSVIEFYVSFGQAF